LYGDDTALVVTQSRKLSLLVSYLETYLLGLKHWLRDWKIATSVSKSTVELLAKIVGRILKPGLVHFFGEPIQWIETARNLGVTLHTRLNCMVDSNQLGRNATQRFGVLDLLLNRRSGLSIRNGVLLYKQLIRPVKD
jgi:pyruvate-formate lyase-activating enzyme